MEDEVIEAARRLMEQQAEEVEAANSVNPVIPSIKTDPLQAAQTFMERFFLVDGRFQFAYWRESWYSYWNELWSQRTEEDVEKFIHNKLQLCRTIDRHGNLVPHSTAQAIISELKFQVRNLVCIPSHYEVPAILGEDGKWRDVDATSKAVCRGQLVNLMTGETFDNRYMFIPNGAKWRYDASAPTPNRWLDFLDSLGQDPGTITLLQEWMGYVLSGDTWAQKGLIMVGPPRAGKGLIGHVMRELLGDSMVSSPSLSHLGTTFGLEGLTDKRLCLISDARLSSRADTMAVVEILLRVIARDSVAVQRKFKTTIELQLPVRVMMLSNEMPALYDNSDAIAHRFVLIQLQKSFLGREDHKLKDKLMAELPSIALWCIEGYKRLMARGRFLEPEESRAARNEWYLDSNPVVTFIDSNLQIELGKTLSFKVLYERYKVWCEEHGHSPFSGNMLSRRIASHYGRQVYRSKDGKNDVCWRNLRLADGGGF